MKEIERHTLVDYNACIVKDFQNVQSLKKVKKIPCKDDDILFVLQL